MAGNFRATPTLCLASKIPLTARSAEPVRSDLLLPYELISQFQLVPLDADVADLLHGWRSQLGPTRIPFSLTAENMTLHTQQRSWRGGKWDDDGDNVLAVISTISKFATNRR